LQFVSGLGPRKAQTIISKIVQSGGKLENRSDLVTKGLCGSKVFVNSASFIRIRSRHFVSGYRESALDVLDDTRVHPEDYELARKMAIDTLEIDDGALEDEDNPSAHVQELMDGDVEKLNTLLLDDYAVELERRIHQPKRICLEEIKEELMNPYGEKRQAFAEASNDVVFTMLTGETDETLRQGVILSVSVLRARHKLVECLLQSGLVGTISIEQIDLPYDHQDNPRLNLLYPSHTTILAQVLDINKDEMHVQLSARLNNTTPDQMIRRDPFFSKQRELDDNNRRSGIRY
jgi:transcription elongation factor SPT6